MRFSHLLGASALAGTLAMFSPAGAQVAPAGGSTQATGAPAPVDQTDVEEEGTSVLVTGSRIPRPEFEGNLPGVQVRGEQIDARGFTNILDALNDLPLVGPGASAFGTNGGQPASLGASFVDLLDLGTQRTLTLVNNRRFVSGNAGSLFVASNATGSQVNLNSLPTALVERIDTLTVGGAAVYGSDAIAGVVNVILKTDYNGVRVSGRTGINQRGDGASYQLSTTVGRDFAGGRGNISFSIEGVRDEALFGDSREGFRRNFIAPTSFRNGSVRNTSYVPAFGVATADGPFRPIGADGVPNNIARPGFSGGSILVSNPGSIFQANANIANFLPSGFQGMATTDPQSSTLSPQFRPQVLINQAGNTNLVPGTPIAAAQAGCNTATFACLFAPSALPTANAAFVNGVIARYAPTLAANTTASQAQRNALALQLLQANSQTPREYLARNPNTPLNAFIGSLIPNFLDVANPDAASAGVFGRTAVPLQFTANGQIRVVNTGTISDPALTPGTTGGAVTNDFFDTSRFNALRIQQQRLIGNLFAHFDLTPNVTIYTENLYSRSDNLVPRTLASSNAITGATAENAALVMNINNPFLDPTSRAALRTAGVTGPFVLSRSNQDIVGDNPARVLDDTYRSVVGVRGRFDAFGKRMNYDASFTYGRSELSGESLQIKDIEYALALNAVQTPNGIACAAQTTPGIVGTTPPGVVGQEIVRERGPDGTIVERTLRRTVTAEQVAACRPLNVFGYGQMSEEARQYVLARTGFRNLSQQYIGQAFLSGEVLDLPGGAVGVSLNGDYRRETMAYEADSLSATGATRTAALAATSGKVETVELGGELRVPIFGQDFTLPLLRNVEFSPAIRFSRQNGEAPPVRLLNGTTLANRAEGRWNSIYTLGGTWRPVRDILIRGNYTRSIRQPSIVELFLGGQPAFTTPVDPCAPANIGQGLRPDTRRANCERAVVSAGLATNQAEAASFLNAYVPSGAAITGNFSGTPGLRPERGKSWTVGAAFAPRFVPGLNISADYINVLVADQIVPTTIATALQVCYDSPSFPNTATEVGVDVCSFFNRIPSTAQERRFEVDNGFSSGFINLGGIKVEAVNMSLDYDMPLNEWIGDGWGKLNLYANAYHLIGYGTSPTGTFQDTQESAGSLTRPKWRLQGRARYEHGLGFIQWVWNWQNRTALFNGGAIVPGTDDSNEQQDYIRFASYGTHNLTMGFDINEKRNFRIQLNVNNVFDKQYIGTQAQAYGFATTTTVDNFGRRFLLTATAQY